MEVTITVYEIPITREDEKVTSVEDKKSELTQYQLEIEHINDISKLASQLSTEYQKELSLAKHNLDKKIVKKKIITNTKN